MYFFRLGLSSCLAGALAVRAIKNITVDDFDPRIIYSNSSGWTHENSAATLDRFNLTTSYTVQPAFASIKFNGTAVYFMSYGLPLPYPDQYQVTVDGQTETGSLRVATESERAQFIAYSRTGLDASAEHQITISNPFSIPLNIDAFIITVLDNSTMKDGFGSSSEADTGDSNSNDAPGLTTAAKAGIAVGVIGAVLLGVLGTLVVYRWKRHEKSKNRDDTSDPVGRMEEGGASVVQILETRPVTTGGVFPSVEAPGSVQGRPGEFRKDRRPNGGTYRAAEARGDMDEDLTVLSGITSHPQPSSPSLIFPPPYVG